MSILEEIAKQKKAGRKLVLYCAGLHGVLFYNVLKVCGIMADFFSDRDSSKWGTVITDNLVCISPEKLQTYNCMGFICVGKTHYKEICDSVREMGLFEIMEISWLVDELILNNRKLYFDVLRSHGQQTAADIFYDLHPNQRMEILTQEPDGEQKQKQTAVYTAVFGGYDPGCYPQYVNPDMDYFYVSDVKPEELPEYYHWINAGSIIPEYITSPIKRNRFIKMHPHLFLGNYFYSVYVDGNVVLKGDISGFLRQSRSGIAVFAHPARECIYYEALSIVNFKRVNADDVCRQMERYFQEGMPHRYGLTEMPVIVREHMKKECVDIMETWWKEFDSESQRDQLSFMYAMWKNGFSLKDLAILGDNVRSCGQIGFYDHVNESKYVKNES